MIITTTYEGPDLDGYSCSVAYAELLRAEGKDAEARIWGEPHLEVKWLLETYGLERVAGSTEVTDAEVVLLDTSDTKGLPRALRPWQVIEIIDHRKVNEVHLFPNVQAQIELVGAAATLVAERFQQAGVEPSRESALLLYGGILSNTQNFIGHVTDRDREMASWLKGLTGVGDDFVVKMFTAKSDLSGERLVASMKGDFKAFEDFEPHQLLIAQLEIFGVEELLQTRYEEIQQVLQELKKETGSDVVFLNAHDLQNGKTFWVVVDEETKKFLSKVPEVSWSGFIARLPHIMLRKHVLAALKATL